GRTVVGRAVTRLGDVTDARRRPADRGALRVGRAGRGRARAGLRDIANAAGGPTDGRGRLEDVGRTARPAPSALFGRVTRAGGGAAGRGVRCEAIARTVVVAAVTDLGDVADARRWSAHRGVLGVGRTRGIQIGRASW